MQSWTHAHCSNALILETSVCVCACVHVCACVCVCFERSHAVLNKGINRSLKLIFMHFTIKLNPAISTCLTHAHCRHAYSISKFNRLLFVYTADSLLAATDWYFTCKYTCTCCLLLCNLASVIYINTNVFGETRVGLRALSGL